MRLNWYLNNFFGIFYNMIAGQDFLYSNKYTVIPLKRND